MKTKMKKIISSTLIFLMIFAMVPSAVLAADTFTSMDWTSLDAEVKYSDTSWKPLSRIYFNETGNYGAFCLQRNVDANRHKNYEPNTLESFLTNSTVSGRVRAIISQSVINESVADVLADLGLSASSFPTVTECNLSTLFSNKTRGWSFIR